VAPLHMRESPSPPPLPPPSVNNTPRFLPIPDIDEEDEEEDDDFDDPPPLSLQPQVDSSL